MNKSGSSQNALRASLYATIANHTPEVWSVNLKGIKYKRMLCLFIGSLMCIDIVRRIALPFLETNVLMLCINIFKNVFQVMLSMSRDDLKVCKDNWDLSPEWSGTLAPRAGIPFSLNSLALDGLSWSLRYKSDVRRKWLVPFLLRVKWLMTHGGLKLEGPKVPAASYILEMRKPKMLNTLPRVSIFLPSRTQTWDFRLQIRGALKTWVDLLFLFFLSLSLQKYIT